MSLLLAISALLALGYLWLTGRPVSALRSLAKTGATLALCLFAAFSGAPLLALALGFCALGDAALSRDGDRAFLIGMIAFALGHVALTVLMIAVPSEISPLRACAMLLVVALALSSRFWLIPYAGALQVPVRLYVLFIAAMGLAAFSLPLALWPAILGAVSFIASDTILAIEKFRLPEPTRLTGASIWITYYGALLGFVFAFTAP